MIAPAYKPGDRVRVNFWMDHSNAYHGHCDTIHDVTMDEADGDQFFTYGLEGVTDGRFLESELEAAGCTRCKTGTPKHRIGDGANLCCSCYVNAGYAPASWHSECMKANAEIKG